jgi:hypothetical protein
MLGHDRWEKPEHVVFGGPQDLATKPMQQTITNEVEEQTLHLLEEMLANIPDVLSVRLWNGQLWPDFRKFRIEKLANQNKNLHLVGAQNPGLCRAVVPAWFLASAWLPTTRR